MWRVEVDKNVYLLKPIVKLNTEKFGAGLPKGEAGQSIEGYAFYELVEIKDDDGNTKDVVLDNVTASIGNVPMLDAVTQKQLKMWAKAHIVAKHAKFVCK